MKKYTKEILEQEGYKIKNAKITSVSLNMESHGCLMLDIVLEGDGWSVCYGGYCLGKGYVGADDDFFNGSAARMEAIMRIMDVVGVADLFNMKNQYVRVAEKGWGSSIRIIGNIVKEKWFDYETFFGDKESEQK